MSRPVDHSIAAIADRQHGNVTRVQLLALGLTRKQIDHRIAVGRLHGVHRGVYAVGRPPRTALEQASAAVLACGPSAALSHRSALALCGPARRPWTISVTTSTRRHGRNIAIHYSTALLPRDLRRHNGIRVTSPARTLLDCAPLLGRNALARAVNEARHMKQLRGKDLADVVERCPRHPARECWRGS